MAMNQTPADNPTTSTVELLSARKPSRPVAIALRRLSTRLLPTLELGGNSASSTADAYRRAALLAVRRGDRPKAKRLNALAEALLPSRAGSR